MAENVSIGNKTDLNCEFSAWLWVPESYTCDTLSLALFLGYASNMNIDKMSGYVFLSELRGKRKVLYSFF